LAIQTLHYTNLLQKANFLPHFKVRRAALVWNSGVGFHSAELHHSLYHGRAESSTPIYITTDFQAFIQQQETTHPMFLELDGYVLNISSSSST